MKKLAVVALAVIALSACHFGKDEASSSVERNKKYKEVQKETGPEINPDYVKAHGTSVAPMAADTAKATDTAATSAPAPAPSH
jgi:hypothetical protein